MQRSLGLLTLALAASLAKAQSAGPWQQRIARVVKDTVLPSGLTVIIAENHAVPLATVKVSFRGGAAMQGPGEEGLAHLAEHYLFRTYGEDNAFAGEVATLNGTYNGATSEEEVNYFVTLPSKNTASGLRIVAKLVREPKLTDRALAAEKKVVADELARDRSDGRSALRFEMGTQLWADEWFRKNVHGSEQSINAIRLDRIKTMLATQYVPSNAAVIVSGDVDPAMIMPEVIRRFGDWAPGAATTQNVPAVPLAGTKTFAISASDVHLVTVSVQWPGPSATVSPREAMACEVFAAMVESVISPAKLRLMTYGPFVSLGANCEVLRHRGTIGITGVVPPDGTERGLTAIKAELEKLASPEYVNDSLLDAAKQRLRTQAEYSLESGVVLAGAIGSTWSTAGLDYYRNYGDLLGAVTLADIESFVKTYITTKPYVAGALAPAPLVDRTRLAIGTTLGRKTP